MNATDVKSPTLNRAQVEELQTFRAKLQADLKLLRMTGRGDSPRGQALEADLEAVEATLQEHFERVQEEVSARDRQVIARRREEERRREEGAARLQEATEFLQAELAGGAQPAEELQRRAEARGLKAGILNVAAGQLGVLGGRRYATGGRLQGPLHWGLNRYQLLAGWRCLGKVF